ncbi:WD40-repeat-containing domain protein [Syncephalis fuscata]|nr:WD40-repeat-containing domain protein [Syncephalis fuscata]
MDMVEALLPTIGYDMTHRAEGQFYIRRQKYLEYLERRQMKEALAVLRQELTPLQYNPAQLHLLSSLLMSSREELYKRAAWDGQHGSSRTDLLRLLQQHISPDRMIPYGRLETVLRQAIREQTRRCVYHNALDQSISLFGDHCCDQRHMPQETHYRLTSHTDEVWCVAFSHNGRYLASTSRDRTTIIWDTENYQQLHRLEGHTGEVTFAAWSHDDTRLLTCSNDKHARVWNVQLEWYMYLNIDRHKEHVVAGAWLEDDSFITGGLDREVFLWNLEGELKHQWTIGRVTDLDYNSTRSNINSVLLSEDARYALLGLESQASSWSNIDGPLTIWDLDNKKLVHRYHGHTQSRFVIRSCFGGVDEAFVASGSEGKLL